jgi:hypothetical protein
MSSYRLSQAPIADIRCPGRRKPLMVVVYRRLKELAFPLRIPIVGKKE